MRNELFDNFSDNFENKRKSTVFFGAENMFDKQKITVENYESKNLG